MAVLIADSYQFRQIYKLVVDSHFVSIVVNLVHERRTTQSLLNLFKFIVANISLSLLRMRRLSH